MKLSLEQITQPQYEDYYIASGAVPQININICGISGNVSVKHYTGEGRGQGNYCKTAVTPLLMHWSYCSLALFTFEGALSVMVKHMD